jgi:PAS domain S-box-containing protein
VKVLYVEDNPQDAELARLELSRRAPQINLRIVNSYQAALASLEQDEHYDVVLTDNQLPDGDGLRLLRAIRDRGWRSAVVIMTGGGSEETAVAALKAGADDYVVKRADYLALLPQALQNARDRFRAEIARNARPLRVLYAEDDEADASLTRHHLERHARHIGVEVVNSAAEVLRRLTGPEAAASYDVVLLDYRLPGYTALELLRELLQVRLLDLPVVVVTGQGDEELALQVLRRGAADYVVKNPGYLYKLPSVLENAFNRAQLVREQSALRRTNETLRTIIDASPLAITALDDQGRLAMWNVAAERLFGWRAGDVLGQRPPIVPPDEQAAGHAAPEADLRAGPRSGVALRRRRRDGSLVDVSLWTAPARDAHGRITGLLALYADIGDRKRAEAQLAYQANLLANIHDAVIATDVDGKLTALNRAAENLYGWSAAEVLGQPADAVIRTDLAPAQRAAARRSLEAMGYFRSEATQLRRDGSPIFVEGTTIALHDEAGTITGYVSVNRDVTERRQAEGERDRLHRQVRDANTRLQALSLRLLEVQEAERRHLARELHDEIGQQLTGLKLLLDMNASQPGKRIRSSLGEAQEMLQHLMQQVRELSLSLRPAMLDDLGLLPALIWHLDRYTAQTGVKVRFRHSGVEGRRFASEVETGTYRIVQEALTNVARYAQVRRAEVNLWGEADRLRLEIVDEGQGFDPQAVLASNRSNGLAGMSERATLLGGQFRVESVAGAGTRLTAVLPLSPADEDGQG